MMQNIGILFMGHLLVMERLEFGIVIQNGLLNGLLSKSKHQHLFLFLA